MTGSWKRQEGSSLEPWEGTNAAHTLALDFRPPGLRVNTFAIRCTNPGPSGCMLPRKEQSALSPVPTRWKRVPGHCTCQGPEAGMGSAWFGTSTAVSVAAAGLPMEGGGAAGESCQGPGHTAYKHPPELGFHSRPQPSRGLTKPNWSDLSQVIHPFTYSFTHLFNKHFPCQERCQVSRTCQSTRCRKSIVGSVYTKEQGRY